jgi:hypothetical protein
MSGAPGTSGDARLIFAHTQSTSGRLRFVRFTHGMLGFAPFPADARICPDDEIPSPTVVTLPSVYLADAERRLGLPSGSLKIEPDFRQCVDTGGASVDVHLARFTTTDPPFAAITAAGARFIAITETRGCSQVELDLLRKAYEVILGG